MRSSVCSRRERPAPRRAPAHNALPKQSRSVYCFVVSPSPRCLLAVSWLQCEKEATNDEAFNFYERSRLTSTCIPLYGYLVPEKKTKTVNSSLLPVCVPPRFLLPTPGCPFRAAVSPEISRPGHEPRALGRHVSRKKTHTLLASSPSFPMHGQISRRLSVMA